ncbi:DUF4287 domain-containing protein, partial [bacterium]|nr:DUF4287 domain-containing protein [bacterium]
MPAWRSAAARLQSVCACSLYSWSVFGPPDYTGLAAALHCSVYWREQITGGIAMPESPGEMIKSQIRMLEEQSGKPLEYWVKAAKKAGLSKHKEIVDWMKSEHGVKHNQAL